MQKKMEASAEVGFNGSFFDVISVSIGMINYPEPSAPPYYLDPDVDDATLGATLRFALAASKRVSVEEFQKIFHSGVIQKLGEDREKAVMQKYGYKTKRTLYKNMRCCWISVADGKIEIKPTHQKSLDSYTGISKDGPEIQHLPITVSDAELGAALREGFKHCTSAA